MPRARLLAPILAAGLLAACPAPRPTAPAPLPASPAASPALAGSPAAEHSVAAVEAAACLAFAGGGTAVAPTTDPAAAPAIAVGRRYDVALGPARAHLSLTVPRAGEWSVFLGRDHFLLLLDPTEAVQFSLEDAPPPAGCPGIARHLVFALEAGIAYRLELAPIAASDPPLALFVGETHP